MHGSTRETDVSLMLEFKGGSFTFEFDVQ
uniref:Uncharacterized protein n=1 Tax=Anguilla anguilla TaxID=7936 RepID=A0A0E9SEQ0_ANGAN